jgi:hypothetical protein
LETRYLTEQYIKTQIQKHEEGKFTNIKTYSVYKGTSLNKSSYLELTGYKYENAKALIIGADKYYEAKKNFKDDNTKIAKVEYVQLSIEQCQSILNNYTSLIDKIKAQKPQTNEEIYEDFDVSQDVFISYSISTNGLTVSYINLWIKGEKYTLNNATFIKKLKKFISY